MRRRYYIFVKSLFLLIFSIVALGFPFSSLRAALRGDVSGDGKVDIIDIGIVIDNYAKVPFSNRNADVNGDGKVDIIDIGIVIDNYGTTPSGTSVPASGSMWITRSEIAALPTTGAAWQNMNNAARGSWSTPDLKNQEK